MDNTYVQHELIKKAQNGCETSANKIIEDNMGIVVHYLKKYNVPYDTREDFISIGMYAIYKAIKDFNIDKGSFNALLSIYVATEIRNTFTVLNAKKRNTSDKIIYLDSFGNNDRHTHENSIVDEKWELLYNRIDGYYVLEECIEEMDKQFQLLFEYKYINKLPRKEICKLFGMTNGQLGSLEKKFKLILSEIIEVRQERMF